MNTSNTISAATKFDEIQIVIMERFRGAIYIHFPTGMDFYMDFDIAEFLYRHMLEYKHPLFPIPSKLINSSMVTIPFWFVAPSFFFEVDLIC